MSLPKFIYQFLKKAKPTIPDPEPLEDYLIEVPHVPVRRILQITEGEVVAVFDSAVDAADALGDRSKSCNILKVLDPEKPNKSAYGSQWEYEP